MDRHQIEYDAVVPWTTYVRGVAPVLREEGYPLHGLDGLVHSTIPFGSAPSSWAAREIASSVLFDMLGELNLDPVQMALLCQRAENEFVGVNCGILDQYSSTMGKAGSALLLDCRDLTSQAGPVAPGIQVVACDTLAQRALTGSEYRERRGQCEEGSRILARFYADVRALGDVSAEQLDRHRQDLPSVVYRRCRFIVEENQRVLDMAAALAKGDRPLITGLAAASYSGAKNLYEISCEEMEWMMAAMTSGPGAIGARQARAGFGGCMVAFEEEERAGAFASHVKAHYDRSSGFEAQAYAVQSAAGAGPLPF